MKNVQILTTPDCGSCAQVKKMLDNLGVQYEVIDVTENPDILQTYPVMTAPGIVIDGELAFTGVPKKEELVEALESKER